MISLSVYIWISWSCEHETSTRLSLETETKFGKLSKGLLSLVQLEVRTRWKINLFGGSIHKHHRETIIVYIQILKINLAVQMYQRNSVLTIKENRGLSATIVLSSILLHLRLTLMACGLIIYPSLGLRRFRGARAQEPLYFNKGFIFETLYTDRSPS